MKILLRTPNWLGDSVISLPAISLLKELSPESDISLLAHERVADLFTLTSNERIIKFYPHSIHRGIVGMRRLAKEIKGEKFDLAIIFPKSFSSAWIAYISGIRDRIGFETSGRSSLLTKKIPDFNKKREKHLLYEYFELIRRIFNSKIIIQRNHFIFNIGALREEIVNKADLFIKKLGIETGERIFGIGQGASFGVAKQWGVEKYIGLICKLIKHGKVLIFGNKEENKLCSQIAMRTGAIDICGKTDIHLLAGILRRCSLFVGNDTGILHLSSALGTKSIGIFGSTSPAWTSPIGGAKILYKNVSCSPCFKKECHYPEKSENKMRCMKEIPVEEVLSHAIEEMENGRRICVFLDRDGTLNYDFGFVHKREEVRLLPKVEEGVKLLNDMGLKIIVTSNQSGIGRGFFNERDVEDVNFELKRKLEEVGARVDAFYFCPHSPEEDCECRKPKPGQINRAEKEFGVDVKNSFCIGDKKEDMDFGRLNGVKCIAVLTGKTKREQIKNWNEKPDFIAENLFIASQWIKNQLKKE